MKNIDDRLRRSHKPEPRRAISRTFTDTTMAGVYTAHTQRRQPTLKQLISGLQGFTRVHTITKPAALAITLGVIGLLASTSYAALKWLQPDSTLDKNSISTLPNGNIRFWIHSSSCQGQDMEFPVDSYYEIKAGSKVTPEDLRKGIEASCEDDLLMQLFPEIKRASKSHAQFRAGDKQYYTPWIEVRAIDKNGITVKSQLNGRDYPEVTLPFDHHARFYEKGQKMQLNRLKPGDWVTLVSYTTALDRPFSTETISPNELEQLADHGFPKDTRVLGLIRHQYNPNDTMNLMGVMGEDWTRLVEDKKAPDSWRQLVPFDRNWR